MHGRGDKSWREYYAEAVLETDLSELPHRIELAENALQERLSDLPNLGEELAERRRITDAILTLRLLRRAELKGSA